MNNLIIFGGTFNPLTYAHDEVIKLAKEYFKEDKIILLPSNDKFLKDYKNYSSNNILDKNLRLKILKEYCNRNNNDLSLIEIEGKTYKSYDSIIELKKEYKINKCYFLLGSEKINELYSWYKIEDLLKETTFVFFKRNNDNINELIKNNEFINKHLDNFIFINNTNNKYQDVSSTKLRELLKNKDYNKSKEYTFDYIIDLIKDSEYGL